MGAGKTTHSTYGGFIHMNPNPDQLRQARVKVRISGSLVCAKAGISRNRLCQLERGCAKPREGELERIAAVIESLANTRKLMENVAVEGGWPAASI
jgi:predicted transcriptional regulator